MMLYIQIYIFFRSCLFILITNVYLFIAYCCTFRYLLFSMIWIAIAVLLTTIVINLHYRQPSTHKMPPWVRRIFIQKLPRYVHCTASPRIVRINIVRFSLVRFGFIE